MKTYINLLVLALVLIVTNACDDSFIDSISRVEAGADEAAPTISITSPSAGEQLIVMASKKVPVMLEVADDIELESVVFTIDGEPFETVSDFTDYRRYAPVEGHGLDLNNGSYTLKVEGKDKAGKTTVSDEISFRVVKMGDFKPLYGETFYMSFQDHFLDHSSVKNAVVTGYPTFTDNGVLEKAYQGAEGASLSFPVADVFDGNEMSAAFWYNIAEGQGRSGILSASPTGSNNNRVAGFRLFREGGDDAQTIKLNVGNGTFDQWFDGGAAATVNPQTTDWVHVAFTVSESAVVVYINGEVVSEGALEEPISWANCENMYIATGGPHFSEWGHAEDKSQFDELRIFHKALSQDEIKAIIAAED
jgi:hypothetical protein